MAGRDAGDDLLGPHVLATLAHEFRTPLAALHASLELLTELPTIPPDEALDLVRRLQHGVGWLEGLVENLTTWAAVHAGRLPLHRRAAPVLTWIDTALALVQPFLELKGQTVRVRCPAPVPFVDGDPQRLGQVVVNLLANASAYSLREDAIELQVAVEGDVVEVRVTDHGPGLSAPEQAVVFDRYARGAAGAHRPGGAGLGLHIVKTLVELHGGWVGVDSTPGDGAAFWFRLPVCDEGDVRAAATVPLARAAGTIAVNGRAEHGAGPAYAVTNGQVGALASVANGRSVEHVVGA